MALLAGGSPSFEHLTAVYRGTRLVLLARVRAGTLDETGVAFLATETLPVLERIERGLVAGCRVGDVEPAYARLLARRAGITEPPFAGSPAAIIAAIASEHERARRVAPLLATDVSTILEAAAHATAVLASMPVMPAEAVSYPSSRLSYADLLRPVSHEQRVERVEELERTVWRLAARAPVRVLDPALRRTFAFFEAATWLGAMGAPRPLDDRL